MAFKPDGNEGKKARAAAFHTIVQQSDPDWRRERLNEVEYEFSKGRRFRADPHKRGPYKPD